MHDDKNDSQVVEQILEARRLTRDELAGVVRAARAGGGTFSGVSWEEGDGICPEWHFPFPRPEPHPGGGLVDLFAAAWKAKATLKVFPRGIVNPDGLRVVIAGLGQRG